MNKNELEDIEIRLLLEGIFHYYGFDFRRYAPVAIKRRIRNILYLEQLATVSALQEKVLHDRTLLEQFLNYMTVNVTAMFRDPQFYLTFRHKVIPLLRTYPFIRIWCAGCSTGEEVYSLAILLYEENLYHRCRIYATDINETVLRNAQAGIFPMRLMQEYTQSYLQAGGKQSFSEYYTAAYDNAIFRAFLKQNIVFSQHNLICDRSFNEFNAILCRNVLIYFNQSLQQQVHQLLYDSLCLFGILGLGNQESLNLSHQERYYKQLAGRERLYQKIS
ncbi:CheR family methyltransferase [Gloeocapsopsis crepidinum]|uniref:CheR family methyltransferase n=1 Tax=Gloeocapsopsis crepidinum TaxID=693223 RepID=UPI003F6F97CF